MPKSYPNASVNANAFNAANAVSAVPANANANANANAKANARNSKGREGREKRERMDDASFQCMIGYYDKIRGDCKANEDSQEGSCSLISQCKQYGVGTSL